MEAKQVIIKRGRPKKKRLINKNPRISLFSPRGKPGRPDEAILAMEEFEAIRLADLLGNHQKRAAQEMHISQQTFSRIIRRARKSLANALVRGAIIKIQGGTYVFSSKETPQQKPA